MTSKSIANNLPDIVYQPQIVNTDYKTDKLHRKLADFTSLLSNACSRHDYLFMHLVLIH